MDQQSPPNRPRSGGEPRPGGSRGADVSAVRPPDAFDDDQPTFLSMVGLVALVVAVVILVFFGIGYLFGRVFL
jgi:hypothetical protein